MRVEKIKQLIELVEQSQIEELEVRRWWSTVRISKLRQGNHRPVQVQMDPPRSGSPDGGAPEAVATPPVAELPKPETRAEADTEGLVPIVSPMVGSFYRSPSPNAPPYVDVGQRVNAGQVVGIIEAMKLMNEIESEISGTVAKVLVENAQAVEFNQPLYLVKPDA